MSEEERPASVEVAWRAFWRRRGWNHDGIPSRSECFTAGYEARGAEIQALASGWDAAETAAREMGSRVEELETMLDGLERLQTENKEVVDRVQGAGHLAVQAGYLATQEMSAAVKRAEGAEAQVRALEAERGALREAVAEAGIILEALNLSVQWELAPEVRAEIARVVLIVRAALATDPAREIRELRCVDCGSADVGFLVEFPQMPPVCRQCGGSMKETDSAALAPRTGDEPPWFVSDLDRGHDYRPPGFDPARAAHETGEGEC